MLISVILVTLCSLVSGLGYGLAKQQDYGSGRYGGYGGYPGGENKKCEI